MELHPWEKEYRSPKLVTLHSEPQATVRRFFRFLKKEAKIDWAKSKIVDAGCGTGRNSIAVAERGARVYSFDVSQTAIKLAKERAKEVDLDIDFAVHSMAHVWPLQDSSVDVLLDVTSSNALNSAERQAYLKECLRVLKPGSFMYLRTLALEGDNHAKTLLKTNPGSEPGRYVLSGVGIEETVFSEKELREVYEVGGLSFCFLKREFGYTALGGKSYKRQFWVGYLKKGV